MNKIYVLKNEAFRFEGNDLKIFFIKLRQKK